jgi:hypothetical protein
MMAASGGSWKGGAFKQGSMFARRDENAQGIINTFRRLSGGQYQGELKRRAKEFSTDDLLRAYRFAPEGSIRNQIGHILDKR